MGKIFYLAELFNDLEGLSFAFIILGCIAIIILSAAAYTDDLFTPYLYDGKEESKRLEKLAKFKKRIKGIFVGILISGLAIIIVPDRRTYLLMVGGNAVEEVAKNERVQEVAGKTLDLIEQYLDQELNGKKVNTEN